MGDGRCDKTGCPAAGKWGRHHRMLILHVERWTSRRNGEPNQNPRLALTPPEASSFRIPTKNPTADHKTRRCGPHRIGHVPNVMRTHYNVHSTLCISHNTYKYSNVPSAEYGTI